ncbi:MAG TPA: hypothetical protein ENN81_03615 [Phycisphaerales bacterium]|nr:hypothetical protein [Phycisphaerales bacterium]
MSRLGNGMMDSVFNMAAGLGRYVGGRAGAAWGVLAQLTPRERWEAMQGYKTVMTERWFTISGLAAIGVLSALLFYVTYRRKKQELRVSGRMFDEYARKYGLTAHEKALLRDIARRAGIRRDESIFTLGSAFDRGVGRMVQEQLDGEPLPEQVRSLRMELSFLREKLGFKTVVPHAASTRAPDISQLSSRQIPAGRTIHMTRRRGRDDEIEATVVENTDAELAVRMTCHVKVTFGEFWCVRYYFGASVWEFDSSVLSFDGDVLGLAHSENVRFINRRRFLRVPVHRQGYIASFPFVAPCEEARTQRSHGSRSSGRAGCIADGSWGPPTFVPAVITELAGPGLRVEAGLNVKTGDRVLVVFNLDEDMDAGPSDPAGPHRHAGKIVENMGEVRHVTTTAEGASIALELTFLSDPAVGELIRATNTAAVKARVARDEADPGRTPSAPQGADETFTPAEPVVEKEAGHV